MNPIEISPLGTVASLVPDYINAFLNAPTPRELPDNGAWNKGGKCKGRAWTKSTHRAHVKKVAKARARRKANKRR